MRICVVGCGAVGSLFAAHLGRRGDAEIWAYDLNQAHVTAINEHGLRLTGVAEVVGRITATSDPTALPPCDFGIVATKALHTVSAIKATAHALRNAAVCSVQNGVGNEELIALEARRVIRGTTFPAGRIIEPGVVAWDAAGDTWIGPFEPSPASASEVEVLASLLTDSGMPTKAMADARGAQWTKLIFNAATNPIGALTRLTHGAACDIPIVRATMRALVAEGAAVASAQGIELDSHPDHVIDHAAKVAYHHRASMLQDAIARRQTEIDFLNGGIVRFGDEYGIPTPLNRMIWALVKGLERSWTSEQEDTT